MNTDKLNQIIKILEQTNPNNFDMELVHCNGKMCVIGLVYKHFNPEDETDYDEYDKAIQFFNNFIGSSLSFSNRNYILSGAWAMNPETNTIEKAIHRIQKLIAGYEPEDIYTEIEKELADTNLKIFIQRLKKN